jgi:two-component system, response regulator / RNA-binding antiterminator
MLRVLVIDELEARAGEICAGLALAGYQVAALLPTSTNLSRQVEEIRPDVILIQTDSPSRDTLEHLAAINEAAPRPVVMFTRKGGSALMRKAFKAGVSAYVVDGFKRERLKPLVELAIARFEEHQELKQERDDATQKLAERKTIDRAKGVLMKARDMDEETAYAALRKLAMDRGQSLGKAAADVLQMAKVLL